MTQNSVDAKNPIVQIVKTSTGSFFSITTQIPSDNTIPQNTEGDQIITLAITPKFTTSRLEIEFIGQLRSGIAGFRTVALFQDSNANALSAVCIRTSNGSSRCFMLKYFMTSGTTSSTTFKIRVGPGLAATDEINGTSSGVQAVGGVSPTSFKITEFI